MKKFLATVAILPVLALSGTAFASDFPKQGKIASMNGWSVTLDNGMMFQIDDSKALQGLQPGDDVKVTYIDIPDHGYIGVKVEKK